MAYWSRWTRRRFTCRLSLV